MHNSTRVRAFLLVSLTASSVFSSCSSPTPNSPVIRGSSAAAPCPKSGSSSAKIKPSGLNLNVPPEATSNGLGSYESGGYISVRFFGVETGAGKFKAPIESAEGKTEASNPSGVIDVLNIPYCTNPEGKVDRIRIKRCVSRWVWENLKDDEPLVRKLSDSWKPTQYFKTCTAMVSVDRQDQKLTSSTQRRLRVWTAEHCYQPSYTSQVVLNLSAPAEQKIKYYVSVRLNRIDGVDYVKKIVTSDGKGNDSDPQLLQKLFILRSMDGRSANTYQAAIVEGCLNKGKSFSFQNSESKAKNVDCFTAADLSTFKATVDTQTFGEKIPAVLMASERKLSVDVLRKRRTEMIDEIWRVAEKADKRIDGALDSSMKSGQIDMEIKNLLTTVVGSLASVMQQAVRFGDMIRSQMDGIQQTRRYEAMEYELSPEGHVGSFNKQSLGSLYNFFKAEKANFNANIFKPDGSLSLTSSLLLIQELFPSTGLANLKCTLLEGSCYYMTPPGTVELEEMFYGKNGSEGDFLQRRLPIIFLGMVNSALPENNPFKIFPTDAENLVNIKTGAVWTRLFFEAATMRKEPYAESKLYNGIAKMFQQAIFEVCPSAEFFGRLLPVVANLKFNGVERFGSASILGGSSNLQIFPISGRPEDFKATSCGTQKSSVVQNLGTPVFFEGTPMPSEPVIGLDADDSVLKLPPDKAAYEYMTRRVVYKFAGANGADSRFAGPRDSGMAWTFLGYSALALSSHNGQLTNGAVFVEMPDVNTPDPDAGVPVDAQGRPIVNCTGK